MSLTGALETVDTFRGSVVFDDPVFVQWACKPVVLPLEEPLCNTALVKVLRYLAVHGVCNQVEMRLVGDDVFCYAKTFRKPEWKAVVWRDGKARMCDEVVVTDSRGTLEALVAHMVAASNDADAGAGVFLFRKYESHVLRAAVASASRSAHMCGYDSASDDDKEACLTSVATPSQMVPPVLKALGSRDQHALLCVGIVCAS